MTKIYNVATSQYSKSLLIKIKNKIRKKYDALTVGLSRECVEGKEKQGDDDDESMDRCVYSRC